VDQTLLRSAPYAHADRLVDVTNIDRQTGGGGNILTPVKIAGWQAQRSVFDRFEGYSPRRFDLTGTDEPERLFGLVVSTGLFSMLEVSPRLGRGFEIIDGRPGAEPVVLLSDGFWQRRFGADPHVLGRRIVLNDDPHTIIGVMPRRFRLLAEDEALWIPIDVQAEPTQTGFFGLARVRPGVSLERAQREADSTADSFSS
jgi:hypothetical protein